MSPYSIEIISIDYQHYKETCMTKDNFYVMAVNFDREKHKDLVEWLKKQAEENDRSLSSFCISIFKEYRKQKEDENGNK